jgi:hypothetical protein
MGTKSYYTSSSQKPVTVTLNRREEGNVAPMRMHLHPGKVAQRLSIIVILLTVAHTISLVLFYYRPLSNGSQQLHRLFNLGVDGNVPTLFSAFILFAAAALLFILSKWAKSRGNAFNQKRWLVLSMIFIFLGIDEGAMIHDFMAETIRSRMPGPLPGYLLFSWVIPYFFFAVGAGIYFFRFMLQLPARTRNLVILSGVLYVGGALGFEMLESAIVAQTNAAGIINEDVRPLSFYVLETFEEILEMGAIVLFLYTLLDYMKSNKAAVIWKPA